MERGWAVKATIGNAQRKRSITQVAKIRRSILSATNVVKLDVNVLNNKEKENERISYH